MASRRVELPGGDEQLLRPLITGTQKDDSVDVDQQNQLQEKGENFSSTGGAIYTMLRSSHSKLLGAVSPGHTGYQQLATEDATQNASVASVTNDSNDCGECVIQINDHPDQLEQPPPSQPNVLMRNLGPEVGGSLASGANGQVHPSAGPSRISVVSESKVCSICLGPITSSEIESGKVITPNCNCRGDMSMRHRACLDHRIFVKGDRMCDNCNAEITNIPAAHVLNVQDLAPPGRPRADEDQDTSSNPGNAGVQRGCICLRSICWIIFIIGLKVYAYYNLSY